MVNQKPVVNENLIKQADAANAQRCVARPLLRLCPTLGSEVSRLCDLLGKEGERPESVTNR